MGRFLWVCVGGAAGTGARYWLSGWAQRHAGFGFPVGTLAVNVIGSFLLGAIMEVGITGGMLPPTLRIALATGVMGGFTTYSTFNYETIEYLREGAWALGLANVGATVLVCLAAGAAGLAGGRLLIGR
ncbi:MAG TPA: fluoride efflux transporter CrcB [Thermoanaerobaculia bacterium]|nr:fluoride efflux transporter CrcB [Thermoanaerobaculia bacterium]